MKPIMITLLYLTFGGDIKQERFEIFTSCSSWFNTNVVVHEKKKKTFYLIITTIPTKVRKL